MLKRLILIISLLFSSLLFAESTAKNKTFGNWTVKLAEQKPQLHITLTEPETKIVRLTIIHGDLDELEVIYASLNSSEDCKNLDLFALGYETAVAKFSFKNPDTEETFIVTDRIICNGFEIDELE